MQYGQEVGSVCQRRSRVLNIEIDLEADLDDDLEDDLEVGLKDDLEVDIEVHLRCQLNQRRVSWSVPTSGD